MEYQTNPSLASEMYSPTQTSARSSRRSANDREWDAVRETIHQLYVVEKNTLKQTMAVMEKVHKFRRSERKYKDKLKEWKMDKNLSANDMAFIASKHEARSKQEGKETIFYNNGIEIGAERIQNFKKRKGVKYYVQADSSASTPENITYHTPSSRYSEFSFDSSQHYSWLPFETLDTTMLVNKISEPESIANNSHSNLPFDGNDSAALLSATPPFAREGEVTENIIEILEASAKRLKREGRWEEAACEYLELLDEYTRCEGSESLSVANTLSSLGNIFQKEKRFDRSIDAYRKAIVLFEVVCGRTSLSTLRAIVSLAKVYEESGGTLEAKLQYARALQAYEFIRCPSNDGNSLYETELLEGHFECLMYFGDFLCDNPQHIVNSSHIYGHDPRRMFNKAIELAKQLDSNRNLMIAYGSSLEANIERSDFRTVGRIMAQMHILLNEEFELHLQPTVEVLMEGIHLASIYSDLKEWDSAESIFYRVLPKLDLLDPSKYSTERNYGYLECANTHAEQHHLEEASAGFRAVQENLYDLIREEDFNDELARFVVMRNLELSLRKEYNESEPPRLIAQNLERLERERKEAERQKQDEYDRRSTISVGTQDATETQSISGTLSDMDRSSPAASSNKYGKTFSVSDITGIDLSEFYES